MGDFFHGWRRKTGCVLLVIAWVLMGEWERSYHSTRCSFELAGLGGLYRIESGDGCVRLAGCVPQHFSTWEPGTTDYKIVPLGWETFWHIPYWSLVLMVTLVSAYLIVWKPRKKAATGSGAT